LLALRRETIDPCVVGSSERVVKSTGDHILAEFRRGKSDCGADTDD
jgi:hypothetical protein